MDYSKYKQSRDLSWQILIQHNVNKLPIKVSSICSAMNIKLIDYEHAAEIITKFDLSSHIKENDGFIIGNNILYNNKCSVARQRFTVAHELGHYLLHDGKCIYNREPSFNDNPIESEANVFASRLLAPSCVLWGLNVTTPQQIAEICNISMQSAKFRFVRLQELYNREQHFINTRGKSCFLQSPLERKVYEQFEDYINSHIL